jgi:ATP dependent DNA ligase domain
MRVGRQESRRTHRNIEQPALAELTKTLKPTTMPKQPALMQCTLVAEPFDDPDWLFEPKLDGLRVLCWFNGSHLRVLSRQHKEQNAQFPDLIAALRPCLPCRVILDGEVVCLDAQGRSSFRLLQQRLHLQDPTVIKERMWQYPAYLYLFDLLYLDCISTSMMSPVCRWNSANGSCANPCDGRMTSAGPSIRPKRAPSCFKTFVSKGVKVSSANIGEACISLKAAGAGSRSNASTAKSL